MSRTHTHTVARKLPNEMNIDRFVSKRKRKTLPEILAFVCCFNLLALIFHEKRRRTRERNKNAVSSVYIKGLTGRKPSLQMHRYVHVLRNVHFISIKKVGQLFHIARIRAIFIGCLAAIKSITLCKQHQF